MRSPRKSEAGRARAELLATNRQLRNRQRRAILKTSHLKRIDGLIAKQLHPAQLLAASDEAVTKLVMPDDVWAEESSTKLTQAASTAIRQSVADLRRLQVKGGTPLPSGEQEAAKTLKSLVERESKLRAGAWLLARTSLAEDNFEQADDLVPIRQLQAATWLAQRGLDDFWGTKTIANQPYFEHLAASYYNQASEIFDDSFHPQREWADAKLARLETDIDKRVTAAGSFAVQLGEDSDESITYEATIEDGFPQGEAALLLRESGALLPISSSRRIAVAIADESLTSKIAPTTGTPTQVEIHYRGHVASAARQLEPESGVELVHEYKPYETPRVKVVGDEQQVVNVMLVLDCSSSMDGNLGRSDKTKKTKMELAKNAIRNFLIRVDERLQDNPQQLIRVGLMAYGHRYSYQRHFGKAFTFDEFQWNPNFEKPKKTLTSPLADVDILVPIEELTPAQADTIRNYVGGGNDSGTLRPWGETPLYYSIRKAAENMHEHLPDGNNHILVVTDGKNSDYRYAGVARKEYEVELEPKFLAYLSERVGDQIEIFAFALLDKEQEAVLNLPWKVTEAKDQDQLTRRFNSWLDKNARVPEFAIESTARSQEPDSDERLDFGQAWKASKIRSWRPGKYSATTHGLVENPNQDLLLEGWEDITLRYTDRHLEFVPYEHRNRHSSTILSPATLQTNRSNYKATVLVNKRGADAFFELALHNQDPRRQSLAPRALWVEVTPMVSKTEALTDQTYYFCDIQCEQDKPVPILHWTAPEWPQEAARARVEVWADFTEKPQALHVEPIHSKSPSTAKRTINFANQDWTLDFSSLAQFRLSRRGKGDLVLVQPVWPSTESVSLTVERQYSAKPSHEFHLHQGSLAALELHFIDVQKFKEQAWKSQKPMNFPMPRD